MGYYYLSKYQEQVQATAGAAGRIIIPSGVQSITLERRYAPPSGQRSIFDDDDVEAKGEPGGETTLFDPQLYLAALSCDTCSDTCTNLVGYPWFLRSEPDAYDSGKTTQQGYRKQVRAQIKDLWKGLPERDDDIDAAVRTAIDFQLRIGCDDLILPSPLTVDLGTTYATELRWLDRGLEAAQKSAPRKRAFATVAISDTCTFSAPAESSTLLEGILDQVSAREPGGVYILIEQRVEPGYYLTSPHTFRTLLRLASEFKTAGIPTVLVAWVGTAGLPAIAAGADGWASGWYRSERRLKLDDLRNDSSGPAAPAFYSHRLGGEVHPQDLDKVRDANRLDLIEEETPWSRGLFRALRDGRSAKDLPDWTNHAARAHFNTVMIRETTTLLGLAPSQRTKHVARWLGEAERRARELAKIEDLHPRTAVGHQEIWREAFDVWATPTNDDSSRTHSGD